MFGRRIRHHGVAARLWSSGTHGNQAARAPVRPWIAYRPLRLEELEPRWVLDSGPLYLSEFMADNTKTLQDEDLKYSDWIEIYNPSTSTVTLDGWFLTDSSSNLTQWQFPDPTSNADVTLGPGDYLVVFASGKNRRIDPGTGGPVSVFHTNFKLDADGEYLALVQPDGQTIASDYSSKFPKQYADVSYGLSLDLAREGYFTPSTPGRDPESDPTPSLVVINEIMYHPGSGEPGTTDYTPENTAEEYVELYNGASGSVNLAGWQLDGWWFSTQAVKSVTQITHSGTVATVTLTAHGYHTGDWVQILGAAQEPYNGVFPITVVTPNVFTYTMASTPSADASGTITAQKDVRQVSSITTADDYTATVTLAAHGYVDGDTILISGAHQGAYNGVFTISNATANTFTYTMTNLPAAAASGTLLAQKVSESFPDVSIAGKGYLVVAGDGVTFRSKYPAVTNYVAAWTPKLSNSAETLKLTNADGVLVSKVAYASQGVWATRSRGEQLVTGITRSGTTATVTLPYHSYTTGNTIRIAGANEAGFNGEFTITVLSRDTFRYTISSSTAESATGTITAQYKDYLHYGWEWYSPSDGHGKSLELINSLMKVNEGENWGASTVDGGTPGMANSIAATDIAPLITDVEQNLVIPNADDAVTVTADVTDESTDGVTAQLYYRVDSKAADALTANANVTSPKLIGGSARKSITSIVRSGTTATATATSHGFSAGALVVISGADQAEYNGYVTVLSVTANTFTYTVADTAASPATGTVTAAACGLATKSTLTSITRSGTTATATLSSHYYVNGETVVISGANQAEYNGTFTIFNVTSSTFDFSVAATAPSPATGTLSSQPYAISRSGSTAIVSLPSHGYAVGSWVVVSGADQAEYNGTFVVTSVTANTFTYTVSGSPAAPATGITSVIGATAVGAGTSVVVPNRTVSSITRSGTTATVTMNGHGFASGATVSIDGADQPEYNGTFTLTSVTTNTFTYTLSGTPVSPATGTITAARVLASITRSGTTATVTLNAHGYAVGNQVLITGADQGEYNGLFTIATVTTNTFTFTVNSAAPTPATGTIAVSRAGITRSGATATVTLTSHGYTTGQMVLITGARESEYNGLHAITVLSANSFTYSVSGAPSSPATGTITSQSGKTLVSSTKTVASAATALVVTGSRTLTSITRSGTTATATLSNHGFLSGDAITISGATQSEYNGTFTITVTASNTFTFTVASTATTPATGTLVATKTGGSLVRSGTTVTVTLANHGYVNGQMVLISGAEQSAYNGAFTITYLSASTFSYTISSNTATSPATGTVYSQSVSLGTRSTVSSIVRNGTTATVWLANNNYANGQTVLISGADQPEYNGAFVIYNVTANTFDYTITGTPATKATGTLYAQPYAVSRSGATAIVSLVSHGYADGATVTISGATPSDYNGSYTIHVLSNNTFSFTASGSSTTSPTGTITATIRSVTRSDSTVTVTLASHGYVDGQTVLITGAAQSDYNGTFTIFNVTANTFQYTTSGTPASPATGTIYAQAHRISRSGSTAIVYLASHGYSDGQTVLVSGAEQSEYNGLFTITVLTNNTFTYTVSGTPASPATGTITVAYAGLRRSGATVTVPLANHGFIEGQTVKISGAAQAEYNGTFVIFNVTANTFDYTISGAPVSPATGAVVVQAYGITRSGSTVLVYSPSHGYVEGDTVVIEGVNETDYNGAFVIANVTPNTFTYTISSTPSSPATGWASLNRPWMAVTMYDDGQHGDGKANDGQFGGTIPAQANGAIVEYYIEASDAGGRTRTYPAAAAFTGWQGANLLYQVDDRYDQNAAWTSGSAAQLRIIMTAAARDELAYIGSHSPDSSSNAHVNGTFISIDGSGMEVEYQVAIRNRGHGSRLSTTGANNYKISVATDRSWKDYSATLVNFSNPYSQVMGSALWQAAGLAAPNQTPVLVTVCGVNKALTGSGMWGYYTCKEDYDGDFLARAFPDDDQGNLYSVYRLGSTAVQQGDLRYEGTSADAYRTRYFKETNAGEDDWSDLIHMTDVLNNTPDEDFFEEVSKVIDVTQFLRYLALDILTGNTESGLTTGYGDDYGLYRGTKDTRFKLVPWDLDSLFNRAQGYSIFADYLKLTGFARLLTHPDTVKIYYEQLLDLINGVLAAENFNPLVDQVLGGWVPATTITNIKNYVATRIAYVLTQIPQSFTATTVLPVVYGYPTTSAATVAVSGTADASKTRSVLVNGVSAAWDAMTGTWSVGTNPSTTTASFQEGTNGYASTVDTYLSSYAAAVSYATATSLNADGSDGYGGVDQILIRFDNLFGSDTGQVPPAASIVSASLTLYVTNYTNTGLTLNRMLVAWGETDTWSSSVWGGDGVQADGTEASATADATVSSNAVGTWTVDVTAALIAWLADPSSNFGWVLLPLGSDGTDIASSEHSTTSYHPRLSVTYTTGVPSGGVPVAEGINHLLVRAYDGADGTGNLIDQTTLDVRCYTNAMVTVAGGHITANTTWAPANGAYHVTGDLTVDAGATLTILAGTTVYFDTGTGLTVSGCLVAEGTEYAQIRFTRTPGGGIGDGLYFLNTMADNRICYAVIEYGEGLYDAEDDEDRALVALDTSNLLLDHVTLDHARYRRIRTVDSSLIVRNSTFTDIFAAAEAPVANNRCEQIWGKNALPGGHILIENNWFGTSKGHNDIIDLDGGLAANGDPVPQILNNTFTGGGDDACDLEGDFVIQGNVFMGFHKDGYHPGESGEGNCISAGDSDLVGHTYWIVGNVFYDVSHAVLVKDDCYAYFVNNTVVAVDKAAVYFDVPGDSDAPGRGASVDGTIFYDVATEFDQVLTTTDLVVNRSIVSAQWHTYGVGNTDEEPRLVNPARGDFSLGLGSPALGTGPNGLDMGAEVSLDASISGEPAALTRLTSATLTVGGPGVVRYMYRVNGGAWSAAIDVSTPITLTGLAEGSYTVEVLGNNAAGVWQATATTSQTWTVDTSFSRVQINEVLAVNRSAVEHEGTYPDLIELVNNGAVAVDLSGMAISDNAGNPTKYVFPAGTVLGVGEYLVLFADDADTATSGLHLDFELDGDQGGVYLFNTVANGSTLLDAVVYGKQIADYSIGRVGHDGVWTLTQPTFSTANIAARTGDPAYLVINEWFADGDVRLTSDFIELSNADTLPVALAGLSLTDNPINQLDKSVLPALSYVAAGGYVSYTADGDTSKGSSHLTFQLSSNKEWIALLDADLALIDEVVHYDQTTDVSQGRSPDGGTSPYQYFVVPTPGVSNAVSTTITDLVDGLRITEIMYHPADDGDLEFIELVNVGSAVLDLTGVRLDGAVSFTFPAALLQPGQYAVVCGDMATFSAYYGAGVNLLGEYSGKLSDGGDDLVLRLPSPYDAAILRFSYDDAWYPSTDGDGLSLVIVAPAGTAASWDDQSAWQASSVLGGSPGRADGGTLVAGVVINEILAHTDEPLADAIELYNTTDAAVDISGWYLSDDGATLLKFRIPDGTILPAYGYVVFYQGHWENHVLVADAEEFGGLNATSFALSSYEGDQVWLTAVNSDGQILYVADYVDFPATANGESLGRWPNAVGNLYPMASRTLGVGNATNDNGPRVGPVVISEIMYAPTALTSAETAAGFSTAEEMEYIEIHNGTDAAVELAHWHLDEAVSFDFASGTWLAAHGTLLVVSFAPSNATMLQAFRDRYGIDAGVIIVGPYSGHLSESGERLVLQDSDTPPLEAPDYWPPLLEDAVAYASAWGANGDGLALQRVSADSWGMSQSSWTADAAAPGEFNTATLSGSVLPVSPTLRGTAVAEVQILFNRAVTGFDLGDLQLTRDGGANLLTAAQTLTTSDSVTWTVGNLAGLTLTSGNYVLTLVAAGSGIQDAEANALSADSSTAWTMDADAPTASIAAVTPNPRNTAIVELVIVFSEAVSGLELADLQLTRDGGANLLDATPTLTTADSITWTLGNLSVLTTAEGSYQLILAAASSGVVDGAGNALAADVTVTWTTDTSTPTALVLAVTPNPRNTTVSQVQLVFSEAVTGLDLADLRLTCDGGANLLTGSESLGTTDQLTWTLSGLAGLTGPSGVYTLTLVAAASGVQDFAGNLLVSDAGASWTMDLNAPTVTIVSVSPNPRETSVAQLVITFNEAVVGFTLESLSLSFAGGANLLTAAQTLTTTDSVTWILANLADLTGSQGVYTLTVSPTGIADTAGNALAAGASTTWTLFLASLDADGNGAADALTDGILILRYLFDPSGEWNYADALGSGATRTTRDAVRMFLENSTLLALDADGNGAADALTDGILILRYLFDPSGEWNYADALGSGATRTTRDSIRAYLDGYNPSLALSASAMAAVAGATPRATGAEITSETTAEATITSNNPTVTIVPVTEAVLAATAADAVSIGNVALPAATTTPLAASLAVQTESAPTIARAAPSDRTAVSPPGTAASAAVASVDTQPNATPRSLPLHPASLIVNKTDAATDRQDSQQATVGPPARPSTPFCCDGIVRRTTTPPSRSPAVVSAAPRCTMRPTPPTNCSARKSPIGSMICSVVVIVHSPGTGPFFRLKRPATWANRRP